MSDFLVMIVSVSVVLGVMVLVHEWGHFIVAKAVRRARRDLFHRLRHAPVGN